MYDLKKSFSLFLNSLTEAGERFNYAGFAARIQRIKISSLLNLPETSKNYFYWNKPADNLEFIGFDECLHFKEIEQSLNFKNSGSFFCNWDKLETEEFPLFIGSQKFNSDEVNNELWEDYSNSEWYIPKFLILNYGNTSHSYLVFNFAVKPNAFAFLEEQLDEFLKILDTAQKTPKLSNKNRIEELEFQTSEKLWTKNINKALKEIERETFKKVVLSRISGYSTEQEISSSFLIDELAERYPDCYIFGLKKNDSLFFGASPEKLLKMYNGTLEIDSLAGSAARGSTGIKDKKLGDELLNSGKNRREQKTVTRYIENILSKYTAKISSDENPKLKKLKNIQHLWTVIKADLNEENLPLILKELHPTPAVCGMPKQEAIDFILQNEDYPRGYYAGFTGWIGNKSSGEFCVSIRSALLRKNKLYLFAGCGIVEGSEPEKEYEETKLKLKPILSLFNL